MASSSNELPVGRIAGIFGIRGELKCDPTSAGRMLFLPHARLHIELADGSSQDVEISAVREHKGRLLIRLHGIESANDAQRYVGSTFYAERRRIKLERGEYLDVDLVGCMLYDPHDAMLGLVTAVEHYPSSDMLVVNGKLVPMVSAFIKSIDTPAKRIVADLPAGLLDDDRAEQA
jgi:16S rRNA processing protein RimM